MKRLLNPIWRLLTTVKIYATDKETLEQTWKDDYQPFGYEIKKPAQIHHNSMFGDKLLIMSVCKSLV